MLFCIACLLILWTLSKCYCVKCSIISPILFFNISQGSAATHIRCDEQCGMSFVAKFLENTTVKEFCKSANICQSYERKLWHSFFWLTVYISSFIVDVKDRKANTIIPFFLRTVFIKCTCCRQLYLRLSTDLSHLCFKASHNAKWKEKTIQFITPRKKSIVKHGLSLLLARVREQEMSPIS